MRTRHLIELDTNIWKAGAGNTSRLYKCRICKDEIWREAKHCDRHVTSQKHLKMEKFSKEMSRVRCGGFYSTGHRGQDSELESPPTGLGITLSDQFHGHDGLSSQTVHGDDTYSNLSPVEEGLGLSQYSPTDEQPRVDDVPEDPSLNYDSDWQSNDGASEMQLEETTSEIDWIAEGLQVDKDTYSDEEPLENLNEDGGEPSSSAVICLPTVLKSLSIENESRDWFPWPNKLYCVLDIFRNLPRSTLSEKQHALILWGLRTLGISFVPSESTVKSVVDSIQYICGVKTSRYKGALGHVYYVNDFSMLIAQEMANPKVREHIEVYPEDAEDNLQHAYQGRRWLHELDPGLLTQMIRQDNQDFYSFEPAILADGSVAVPVRWFRFRGALHAFAWRALPATQNSVEGWYIHKYETLRIPASEFSVSFPYFCDSFAYRGLPDPRNIIGMFEKPIENAKPWIHSNPQEGNKWRTISKGHRVYAFPIWLYCDDTSGNLSKKWNEHNSFLFTPAGLSQEYLHRQYNVHFLCTSNIAPPLEMLDGVVDQILHAQNTGVWAWDCAMQDSVLLIPSVLGLLGDNPMQSEFACHVGMNGNLFCRICIVTSSVNNQKSQIANGINSSNTPADQSDNVSVHSGCDDRSVRGSDDESLGAQSNTGEPQVEAQKTPKMSDWVKRAQAFLKIHAYRYKEKTMENLSEIFSEAKRVGGKSNSIKLKTKYGVKDTYQEHFTQKIFNYANNLDASLVDKTDKQNALNQFTKSMPSNVNSPIWRIKEIDPHKDTPVELLHVVLLGCVKYFWRDAIARINDEQKRLLMTRLSSFNTSGLNLLPLAGKTLVQYSGSLTGRDFRALVQVGPFVLYGLLPPPCFSAWIALSFLAPLLWQPAIYGLEEYSVKLKNAIDYFLDCVAAWTPRWFNKPKFHILLHLVEHVLRFGPPHTFATETFESYNSFIRDLSVHSNRQAPSRDIGYGFANANRIRHLVSGGKFLFREDDLVQADAGSNQSDRAISKPLDSSQLRSVGPKVLELFQQDNILRKLCGILVEEQGPNRGSCEFKSDRLISWTKTFSSQIIPEHSASQSGIDKNKFRICKSCRLENDDHCVLGQYVIIRNEGPDNFTVGKLVEMLQVYNSVAELERRPSLILLSLYKASSVDKTFLVPKLISIRRYALVDFKDVLCAVNVQHNCASNECQISMKKRVYQEREKTKNLDPELDHINPEDVLLNCFQMRSYRLVQYFNIAPPALNREFAIHEGAAREIEIQRAKQQKKGRGRGKRAENDNQRENQNENGGVNNGKKKGNGKGKEKENSSTARARENQNQLESPTANNSRAIPHPNNIVPSTSTQFDYQQTNLPRNLPRNPARSLPSSGYQYTSRSYQPDGFLSPLGSQHTPISPNHPGNSNGTGHHVQVPARIYSSGNLNVVAGFRPPNALGPFMQRLGIRTNSYQQNLA